jgi:23S rRNA (guanosine2251-2'-O)-methyltransferase
VSVAREPSDFVIYGVNPVKEKLAASKAGIIEILIVEGSARESLGSIDLEARRQGIPVRLLSSVSLTSFAGTEKHQGVAARVRSFEYGPFERFLDGLSASGGPDWILALDSLTDPRNLGAILRTAEAVGIRHAILPRDRTAAITGAAVKASAGAAFHVVVYKVVNLRRALLQMKEKGYWIVGLDTGAEEVIYRQLYPEKLVVVIGAEGTGLRPLVRNTCDFLASIPMYGQVGSLNVSVAAGIFLYELARRKNFR